MDFTPKYLFIFMRAVCVCVCSINKALWGNLNDYIIWNLVIF